MKITTGSSLSKDSKLPKMMMCR